MQIGDHVCLWLLRLLLFLSLQALYPEDAVPVEAVHELVCSDTVGAQVVGTLHTLGHRVQLLALAARAPGQSVAAVADALRVVGDTSWTITATAILQQLLVVVQVLLLLLLLLLAKAVIGGRYRRIAAGQRGR